MSRSDVVRSLCLRVVLCVRQLFVVAFAVYCLMSAAVADQVDYTYDDLGRLKTVTYEDGTSVVYDYDPVGNRTTQTIDVTAPAFAIGNSVALEGDSLSFTVTKVGSTALTHNVNYATANGTAVAGSDYTSKSGTLSFTSAQSSQTVVIAVIEDSVYEDNETALVNLSSATNGATISDSQGIGTISNDDTAPAFSINNVSAEEGNNLSFIISKSGSTSKSHSVDYATANGTASAGSDYTTKSGTLTFTTAQSSQAVTITGIEDTTFEPNETFYVNLSSATSGSMISDSQGLGTVTNDDVANSPPVANDNSTSMWEGDSKSPNVLLNDTDPDGDPLTIISVTQPFNAIVTITSSTSIYVLSIDDGTETFTYTISDGNGGTDTATVTVVVQAEEDDPW